MNHIIWRFGFYDKNSKLAQSVKKSCSRIYSHKEDGDNWLFLNDEQAVKTADRYAEAVVEYIFVKLGMKPPERKKLEEDIKIKPHQLDDDDKEEIKTWLNTHICGKTGNIDESEMADRLNLLIRGHYLELKEESWFNNLMPTPSDETTEKLKKILKKVFNYEYFSDTAKKYRSDLLSATKITVCPYCDRQYISYYSDDKTTADLDHFWDKSEFPYFALSLFNFIPSCHTCNSTFKGTKNLKVYPYRSGFDTRFDLKPESEMRPGEFFSQVVIGSYKGRITVKQCVNDNVSDSRKDEIENDISVLKLNDLYTEHGDYVRELLTVKHLYEDEDYIRQVNDILKNSLKKDGMNVNFPYPVTKEGVRAFLIGDTDGDESGRGEHSLLPQKRPLAALTSAVMSDEYPILTNSVKKK